MRKVILFLLFAAVLVTLCAAVPKSKGRSRNNSTDTSSSGVARSSRKSAKSSKSSTRTRRDIGLMVISENSTLSPTQKRDKAAKAAAKAARTSKNRASSKSQGVQGGNTRAARKTRDLDGLLQQGSNLASSAKTSATASFSKIGNFTASSFSKIGNLSAAGVAKLGNMTATAGKTARDFLNKRISGRTERDLRSSTFRGEDESNAPTAASTQTGSGGLVYTSTAPLLASQRPQKKLYQTKDAKFFPTSPAPAEFTPQAQYQYVNSSNVVVIGQNGTLPNIPNLGNLTAQILPFNVTNGVGSNVETGLNNILQGIAGIFGNNFAQIISNIATSIQQWIGNLTQSQITG